MYLQAIASAFPPSSYTQAECWERIRESPQAARLRPRSLALIEKVLLGESGIGRRHFCIEEPTAVFQKDAETLSRDFERFAPEIGGRALATALDQAGWLASEIDALFVCTCTGYLCPGVSSHLAERLELRRDVFLQDLVGLGCGAALPTLRSASGFLTAYPGARVAVVAVEICSAAFYIDDDPGVLISLCLFGDGASASLWRQSPPSNRAAYRISGFQTVHKPEFRERIRFVNSGGRLKNQLHRTVPELAAASVRELFDQRPFAQVEGLIMHPGGRDVLNAIQAALPGQELLQSRSVLWDCGNLSSPSVLVALERELHAGASRKALWMSSFGAGFACHAATLIREE